MSEKKTSKNTFQSKKMLFDVLSKIASSFARLQSSDHKYVIEQSLSYITHILDVDRMYIFKYSDDYKTISNLYEYVKEGIDSVIDDSQDIPLSLSKNWLSRHMEGKPTSVPCVENLPINSELRRYLSEQSVKSLYAIPLFFQETLWGFVGYDAVIQVKKLTKFEHYVLSEYANMLINLIERLSLEEILLKERQKRDDLLSVAHVAAWEWNIETNQITANGPWSSLIGYTDEELASMSKDDWVSMIHPKDKEETIACVKASIAHPDQMFSCVFRMIQKQGTTTWIKSEGKVQTNKQGKPSVLIGAFIDISSIKQTEMEKNVVYQAIKYSPTSVLITDQHGVIQYVNPKFEELSGFTSQEVIGKNPKLQKSGYHTKSFYKDMYQTLKRGHVWNGEFQNKRKDGTLYWESASMSAVFDEDGEITNYISVKEDISEKKHIDEILDQRRRDLENEVEEKVSEIADSQQSTIIALAKLTEARDATTGYHVERVQHLSRELALALFEHGYYKNIVNQQFISDIFYASALHDIGKISIPDHILLKPGKLTYDEFEIMKSHVTIGEKILSDIVKYYPKSGLVRMGREIAQYHHERWNGTGYIEGVQGEHIPLSARIMALVDVYDALRSKRPYKDDMTHEEVYQLIVQESGHHFDPLVVEAFQIVHERFKLIFESLKT